MALINKFIIFFIFIITYTTSFADSYDFKGLKFKYFRYSFPPVNTMVPSPADYQFVGEWLRRKGGKGKDYQIKIKQYVYRNNSHQLVYVKFKRHGMPFCWWFSKLKNGRPPKGWSEGACDVDNDGVYEKVWDLNGYDKVTWNFCDYWNCESY
jgi:hypothetical protein